MFNTKKFGGYLSKLRKNADMTQSELAYQLNLTRQAISSYERGDSFPDVSILIILAEIFKVTLDDLINAGEPTRGEAQILSNVTIGNKDIVAENITDLAGLAPLLKPSILNKLADGLMQQGIDISSVVLLAEFLSDTTVAKLLEKASYDELNNELLEKMIPFLDNKSKETIFQKVIVGEMDYHMLVVLFPYADYLMSQIEAAVLEGAIPSRVLVMIAENYKHPYDL